MTEHDKTETNELLKLLLELTGHIAHGEYGDADRLFDLTRTGKNPEVIRELAESFGMMMVQVEGREFRLSQLVEQLENKNSELEAVLRRVRLLENIKNHLCKFVPASVKHIIEKNPENPDLDKRDADVTVLFLDIAGYTRLSEHVDPHKVSHLVETYFSVFLDEILDRRGDVNETAGDGLMIIYQDESKSEHAACAVETALAITKKTAEINTKFADKSEPVTINIGINSGVCSVGSVRFQGVSGERWVYTASGNVTNLASRIGKLAVNGAILVGPETYARVRDRYNFRSTGEHHLKNIDHPVTVYEVMAK